jgi:virginiamycin B lyase
MAGVVTEFPVASGQGPEGIIAGPDGKVWFTEIGTTPGVARINTDGTGYVEFRDPDGGFGNQIAAGPDGNLWYVDYADSPMGNQVGRVTPSGQITEYSAGFPANGKPTAITAGPDGRMWFTLSAANQIGAITTGG